MIFTTMILRCTCANIQTLYILLLDLFQNTKRINHKTNKKLGDHTLKASNNKTLFIALAFE